MKIQKLKTYIERITKRNNFKHCYLNKEYFLNELKTELNTEATEEQKERIKDITEHFKTKRLNIFNNIVDVLSDKTLKEINKKENELIKDYLKIIEEI